jgi:putative nucleotidyltransferase with HDIG domain
MPKINVNVAAIILAAGMSSRMGEFKPLLPLGNKTVIEQVVATFLHAGVQDIQVVLGYKAHDVIAVLQNLAMSWIINDNYQSEMFSSVKAGADGLKPDSEAVFILPVDIPLVRPQTLELLMGSYGKDLPQIIYPSFLGRRGHPPLISRQYAEELTCWSGHGGLKVFLEQYDHRSFDVPVFDEGILMDMDTPEQYRQIVTRYEHFQIPLKTECMAMMAARFSENHPVIKHSRVVARVARDIGKKLVQAGCQVNIHLIEACGYLHDIGKGKRHHAGFGAEILKKLGYPHIADIVLSHMDLPFQKGGRITEKEVLYLADKMAHGDRIMPLDSRLESKLSQLADKPEGKIAAEKRIRTAMNIQKTIERITGEKIFSCTARQSGST